MDQLMKLLDQYDRKPENLLHILLDYQQSKDNNCISEDEIKLLAKEMKITESRIYSVVTFYSLFSTEPRGKYIIQVCHDIPCHVNGSTDIVETLEDALLISMGETTSDGVFTLEYTSCLGCCDMAPAMRIDGELFGNLDADKIAGILAKFRRKFYEERE